MGYGKEFQTRVFSLLVTNSNAGILVISNQLMEKHTE
jgi:hypothetical protein